MRRKTHPWGTSPWTVDFTPVRSTLPNHTDFVVVGAGFAGLSAATWLRRLDPSKSVLALESASLGEGASGRTGGMALAETAAGDLPGLGDVLAGYKRILRTFGIDSRLELPGAWELARSSHLKNSPISWNDSGELQAVRLVPGGTVNPGKVLSGLARSAQNSGAQIVEHAKVLSIDFSSPLRLQVQHKSRTRSHRKTITAGQILLATNAFSIDLTALQDSAAPKLTFALATAPLSVAQHKALGLASRRPFYTVDFPYLWGRLLESNGAIFGAGLVPMPPARHSRAFSPDHLLEDPGHHLDRYHIHKGESADRLRSLEERVHNLHPALKSVRITHRWAGPILFTDGMRPIFRNHPHSKDITILAGFNGHGVALSVYLGQWAAQSLLGQRSLPRWS
jgi:glycine/D-amino acid oxidase-like deaminating enzyme